MVARPKIKYTEYISDNGKLIAIIVRDKFKEKGACFFTPNRLSQQLAYMRYPKGRTIQPHIHNPIKRQIMANCEVLFIKKGRLRVHFYSYKRKYLESRILKANDLVLLVGGGHGFKALKGLEMIEVKQGPYLERRDNIKF
jgi:hypothetical protein